MGSWFGFRHRKTKIFFPFASVYESVVAPVHTDHIQRYAFVFSGVTVSFGNLTTLGWTLGRL